MNDPFIQTENIRKFQMKGLCLTHIMSLAPLYTPLKTSENLWFSDVFRG